MSLKTLREISRSGMILLRMPTSVPLVRTRSGDGVSLVVGSTGSSVVVAPRASC